MDKGCYNRRTNKSNEARKDQNCCQMGRVHKPEDDCLVYSKAGNKSRIHLQAIYDDRYWPRPECEKSTQTLLYDCPRCNRESTAQQTDGSIRQLSYQPDGQCSYQRYNRNDPTEDLLLSDYRKQYGKQPLQKTNDALPEGQTERRPKQLSFERNDQNARQDGTDIPVSSGAGQLPKRYERPSRYQPTYNSVNKELRTPSQPMEEPIPQRYQRYNERMEPPAEPVEGRLPRDCQKQYNNFKTSHKELPTLATDGLSQRRYKQQHQQMEDKHEPMERPDLPAKDQTTPGDLRLQRDYRLQSTNNGAKELHAPLPATVDTAAKDYFRKELPIPLTKDYIPKRNPKQVNFQSTKEGPAPTHHKNHTGYQRTYSNVVKDVPSLPNKDVDPRSERVPAYGNTTKQDPLQSRNQTKFVAPSNHLDIDYMPQSQQQQPQTRRAPKSSQYPGSSGDRVLYNNARFATDLSVERGKKRDSLVDLLYYKKPTKFDYTSTDSTSALIQMNEDMARMYDLYTTDSASTQQAQGRKDGMNDPPKTTKHEHQLPSLGLTSPSKNSPLPPNKSENDDGPTMIVDGFKLSAKDMIDTLVTAPMIRRVQRIYRANLAEQMLLVQELDSIPKLVKETLENARKN
ncbi:uncharacterized protein LOC115766324 [Drosophila novamexicana]|uniref:uncharacterized protein LOC115766324 n=1 Tax=Drosophila novamexicana TaxID=47314 RepID=UPI0011E5E51F|nr:uncharacterized protein LOC115766324 [Drosophila novamexicana]XP_030566075.1 uncharacterized protein LOC115766324 [Drosophila novamexicana]